MKNNPYSRLTALSIILLTISYTLWYGVNWYAAGLTDQTDLIEFGMEEDFIYCNDWRPQEFDLGKLIENEHPEWSSMNHHRKRFNAISWASRMNQQQVLERLLKNGIDPNLKDAEQDFPLQWAAANGHNDAVQLLINYGADVNLKNRSDRTALQLSCANRQEKTARLLLKNGADINAADFQYTKAIHWVVFNGDLDFADDLIARYDIAKSDLETACCGLGLNLLFHAIYKSDIETVKWLLDRGVNPNANSEYTGMSPRAFARTEAIAELIGSYGGK